MLKTVLFIFIPLLFVHAQIEKKVLKSDLPQNPIALIAATEGNNYTLWEIDTVAKTLVVSSPLTKSFSAQFKEMVGDFYSNDLTIQIVVLQDDSSQYVRVNGEMQEKYSDVTRPIFSSDSKHYVYRGYSNGMSHLILDGKEIAEYENVSLPTFNPDNTKMAFITSSSTPDVGSLVIYDLETKETMEMFEPFNGSSYPGIPEYSPDGKSIAYAKYLIYINENGDDDPKYVLCVDSNQVSSGFTILSSITFNSSGTKLLFLGYNNLNYQMFLVDLKTGASSVIGGEYSDMLLPTFSESGNSTLVVAKRDNNEILLYNGLEEAEYVQILRSQFIPKSEDYIYVGRDAEKKFCVVTPKKTGEKFKSIIDLRINKSGTAYAYSAQDATDAFIVVNDTKYKVDKVHGGPVFLDDSTVKFLSFDNHTLYENILKIK